MKRILFGCIGAGLAIGGAYFLYKRWQKYQLQCREKNNEPTFEKSEDFIPSVDEGIPERLQDQPICAVEPSENASKGGETITTNTDENTDVSDFQIYHEESLKPENASAKADETVHVVQHSPDLPLRADELWGNTSKLAGDDQFGFLECLGSTDDENAIFFAKMKGFIEASFASKIEAGRLSHTDSEQSPVDAGQMCEAETSSYGSSPSTSVFDQKNPTFEKSQDFIPSVDEGIAERPDLPICAVEPGENASKGGETITTNTDENTDVSDFQIYHEESLKPENASAKADETVHVVQHSPDLPLRADEAWGNTSKLAQDNFRCLGVNWIKIPLEGTNYDEDMLFEEMKGFIEASFASLLEGGRVSHTDSEQSPVDAGQKFEAGTSSYASSPSTSGFDQQNGSEIGNQPHGAVKKKTGSKRIKKRKYKKK